MRFLWFFFENFRNKKIGFWVDDDEFLELSWIFGVYD
jgi:hypothetical protein